MTAALDRRLDRLAGVGLTEIDAIASLQDRIERKYVVSPAQLLEALDSLRPAPRVLEIHGRREFHYESLYFDTLDRASYRDAARRRPARFKVRQRHYLDSGATALEVKRREASGRTVKHREWCEADAYDAGWSDAARAFLASVPGVAPLVDELVPSLVTQYRRTTLLVGASRATLDLGVTAQDATGRSVALGEAIVVETKVARHACEFDRALWRAGARPERLSKYCTSLAALDPALPRNRWHRTLVRHPLGPAPALVA